MVKVYFTDTAGKNIENIGELKEEPKTLREVLDIVIRCTKITDHSEDAKYSRVWQNPDDAKIIICDFGSHSRYIFLEFDHPVDMQALVTTHEECSDEN